MVEFRKLVKDELERARKLHGKVHSFHEGFAVILEEVDEFKEEVWKKEAKRDPKLLLGELVQIAAMCNKIAEDMGLLENGQQAFLS